jgi:DNA (cytosine-5)-methyltransferase 1
MTTAIDLFAGLGGWSEGARAAGVRVIWAANHWKSACDAYALNHPTLPACQDLCQANFHSVPRPDILLGSSACQGHTHARGKDRPHHDDARSSAWAIVSAAEALLPPVLVVENVTGFLAWKLYPAWRLALQSLGYSLAVHIIDAADHGVPQHRVRVFIVATRSRAPLRLALPRRDHVPAAEIIEPATDWTPVRTLCPRTRARVAAGRREHGRRFLVAYYGNTRGGRSVTRPIGTLTTRDRYAFIEDDRLRMLTVSECRAGMGFPETYRLPQNQKLAKHLLGNAICPLVGTDLLNAIKTAA